MKNYDYQKRIAELLQNYKRCKKEEKELLSNEAIKNNVLSKINEKKANEFIEIDKQIQEEQAFAKTKKKEIKEGIEVIKKAITSELENSRINEKKDLKEETLTFTGIGTVTYSKVTNYVLECTEEEKLELINEIIKNDLTQLLQIDEEKLFEMSKKLKEETGKHIKGVREYDTYETKIR